MNNQQLEHNEMRTYLNLEDVQNASLELLREFSALCERYDLRYDIAGGTLLGAVRHKGFIPWDDDVDVSMPRPDYEKLLNLAEENLISLSDCRIIISVRNGSFLRHYARYCRTDVRRDPAFSSDYDCAFLGIDIFPHDGAPSDFDTYKRQVAKVASIRRLLLLSLSKPGLSSHGKLRAFAKDAIRPFVNLYGRERLAHKLDSLCQVIDFETAKYTAGITGMYGLKERWLKEDWEPQTKVQFEGFEFSTYANFDKYLSNLYGNYMQLPAIDDRKVSDDRFYVISGMEGEADAS